MYKFCHRFLLCLLKDMRAYFFYSNFTNLMNHINLYSSVLDIYFLIFLECTDEKAYTRSKKCENVDTPNAPALQCVPTYTLML